MIARSIDDVNCEPCTGEHAYATSIPTDADAPETVVVTHVVETDDGYESVEVRRAHPDGGAE